MITVKASRVYQLLLLVVGSCSMLGCLYLPLPIIWKLPIAAVWLVLTLIVIQLYRQQFPLTLYLTHDEWVINDQSYCCLSSKNHFPFLLQLRLKVREGQGYRTLVVLPDSVNQDAHRRLRRMLKMNTCSSG